MERGVRSLWRRGKIFGIKDRLREGDSSGNRRRQQSRRAFLTLHGLRVSKFRGWLLGKRGLGGLFSVVRSRVGSNAFAFHLSRQFIDRVACRD